MKTYTVSLLILFVVVWLAGCQGNSTALNQALKRIDSLEARLDNAHTPGWGETMRGSTQVHHSNLWFAGAAGNWELAEHMVEELEEGFEKLRTWYPDDPETVAMPMIDQPLRNLAEAIDKHDADAFKSGYLTLTQSCNACHTATGNAIYIIKTPTTPGFTNMAFEQSGLVVP